MVSTRKEAHPAIRVHRRSFAPRLRRVILELHCLTSSRAVGILAQENPNCVTNQDDESEMAMPRTQLSAFICGFDRRIEVGPLADFAQGVDVFEVTTTRGDRS
jgi:hypothetical protein